MAYQSINPFNEEVVKTFEPHTDGQLEELLALTSDTYQRDWRRRSLSQRSKVLRSAAALLRERTDELAGLATLEMGKLFVEAQREVGLCARIFDYYAAHGAQMLAPREIPNERGQAYVETSPLGPIFCVEPWNYPFYQLARVAAPNLMAGNTLVVKHASNVPQCAVAFEKLLLDAGAPKGAYVNVFLSNDQSGKAIADRRIKAVALTGSERAGSAVAAEAGAALKKCTMELGGSDAFIVLDDADLDLAIQLGVSGRMTNSGQVCDGAKRFVLDAKIAGEFLDRFKAELKKLKAGDPSDPKTTFAPLVSASALEGALKQIDAAVAAGAKLEMGGKRMPGKGFFLEPTILSNVTPSNPVFYQEFFAPVAMVFTVANEQEAIDLANDSPFGLGGAVITKSTARGQRVAAQLDTGMVFINTPAVSSPEMPFGGVKNSGFGRELSDLGIGEFVNRKLVRATEF